MNKVTRLITDRNYRIMVLGSRGFLPGISDEEYLKCQYSVIFGKEPDFNHPVSFNEKMQWLKLHDRNPKHTTLVDKLLVKEFISKTIGNDIVIPTIGAWDSPIEIPYKELPNRFVLKCNHNSGVGMYICSNKEECDVKKVNKELARGLKEDYYTRAREWPYKNVKRKIIAEEYISDEEQGELRDYKVFVFNGVARYIQVDIDRFSAHKRNFYSTEWEYVPFTTLYPTAPERVIPRPEKLSEMLFIAEKISKEIESPPFVRIDLYYANKKIYFGEITFFHGAGNEIFYPSEYDEILGNMIVLDGYV